MVLKELMIKHVSFCELIGLSRWTLKVKKNLYDNFFDFIGNKPIDEITEDEILDFFLSRKINWLTWNNYKKVIAALFNHAIIKLKILKSNPVKGIPELKPRRNLGEVDSKFIPKVIERKNLEKIISNFEKNENFRNYLILILLIETGARIWEIMNIEVKKIEPKRIFLYYTKAGRPRFLPIREGLYKLIIEYKKAFKIEDKYLFPNLQTPGALPSKSGFEKAYRRQRKGIRNPYTQKLVTIHDLRRTFITNRSHLPLYQLMPLAGHSKAKTTEVYMSMYSDNVMDSALDNTKHLAFVA